MKKRRLASAIYLANQFHFGQFDRGGNPYILHPLKLQHWLRCEDEDTQITALLHDAVEDTGCTLLDIEQKFGNVVRGAVDALTKRDGEDYQTYLNRVASNKIAIKVKLADLRHNSDIRRLKGLTEKDFERIKKYQKAYSFLKTQQ